MENQEKQNIIPEETTEQTQENIACENVQQSFYHGVGAGQKEIPFAASGYDPAVFAYSAEPCQVPDDNKPAENVASKKEKKGSGVGMRIVSILLTLALVVGGCCITGFTVAGFMRQKNETLKLHFDEKLSILQDRLEKLEGVGEGVGPLEPPKENLSAGQIYEQNIQSVVAINCTVTINAGFGQVMQSSSAGSGFVMTEDGYIITNHHVVDGATQITVTFEAGTEYAARLIGSDASSDIALLKIEATGLRPAVIGKSSSLAVGDQVVAIGNALGELSFSLTVGYISGIDRDVATDGSVMNMLQTDAAINSGNSGGPLFNARGEVIGINTAKYSGTTGSGASIEGISFAIPIDDVIGMLEDLRDFGYIKGVSMGVYVTDVDAATAEMYGLPMGVYIKEVLAGSPAQQAGLMAKDIITEIGGYEIENMNDLTRALRHFEAGQTATVTVWRSGIQHVLQITFAEKNVE